MTLKTGMHHITAIGSDIQATDAFYRDVLQLQRVKKTDNFDDPDSAHWYWGIDNGKPGTLITYEEPEMEQALVSGIAFNRDEAQITVAGVPDEPGVAYRILGRVAEANIEVDVIIQNVAADNTTDFTFTVGRADMGRAEQVLRTTAAEVGAREVRSDSKIAKVSIVGVGMRSHAGVARTMFQLLASENINIQMITTSEIKISCIISREDGPKALQVVHDAFEMIRSFAGS